MGLDVGAVASPADATLGCALFEDSHNQSISSVLTAIEKVRPHSVHGRRSGEQLREESGEAVPQQVEHCIAHAQHSFAAVLLLPHCCTRAGVVSAGTDAFKFTAAASAQRSLHVQ